MIQNKLRTDTTPVLQEFIDRVLPRHREYYLKVNENANELDFLESLNEIYTLDLSDYIRIKGNDFFDNEIHNNKRIIEYLRKLIVDFKINPAVTNGKQYAQPVNKMLIVDLNKKVLNIDEAAVFVGLSKSYLYKLTSRGLIDFSKPNGKIIFFEKTYLEEWMMSGLRKNKEETEREAMSYCTLSNRNGGRYGKK